MVFIPATCLDHSVSTGAWESQMQPPCGCHTWQNTKFFWQSLLNYVGCEQLYIRRVRQIRIFLTDLYPLYLILLSLSFSILMVPLPCTAFHFIMYPWHCSKGAGKRLTEGYAVKEIGNLLLLSSQSLQPAYVCPPNLKQMKCIEIFWCFHFAL